MTVTVRSGVAAGVKDSVEGFGGTVRLELLDWGNVGHVVKSRLGVEREIWS